MDYYNSKLQVLIDRLGSAFSYNEVYPIMETLKQGYNSDSVAALAMQLIDLSVWLLDQREMRERASCDTIKRECASLLDLT